MSSTFAPFPISDPIARPPRERYRKLKEQDPLEGRLTESWELAFTQLTNQVSQTPSRISAIVLLDQSAALLPTDISNGTLTSGLYRVSWYTRVTLPASTSSSLTISLGWTEDGVSLTFSGAALVGNLNTTMESQTQLIQVDQVTPVTIATAYASVGGVAMKYELRITLEKVAA